MGVWGWQRGIPWQIRLHPRALPSRPRRTPGHRRTPPTARALKREEQRPPDFSPSAGASVVRAPRSVRGSPHLTPEDLGLHPDSTTYSPVLQARDLGADGWLWIERTKGRVSR